MSHENNVYDIEEMFRIVQSVPSKNAEPFKQWLAKLGSERIDETFDPKKLIIRVLDAYREQGYSEEQINNIVNIKLMKRSDYKEGECHDK